LTTVLTPALSSPSSLRFDAIAPEPKAKADRRGRNVRRVLEISCDGIGRMIFRQPEISLRFVLSFRLRFAPTRLQNEPRRSAAKAGGERK
jgi:hypothetical protein